PFYPQMVLHQVPIWLHLELKGYAWHSASGSLQRRRNGLTHTRFGVCVCTYACVCMWVCACMYVCVYVGVWWVVGVGRCGWVCLGGCVCGGVMFGVWLVSVWLCVCVCDVFWVC